MHQTIHLINREHRLPENWNFLLDTATKECGNRPADMKEAAEVSNADSAISYEEASKSEELDTDKLERINRLKSKMHKKYSALS